MAPIHGAIYTGQLEIVKVLLDAKADISAKTNEGNTVIHCAALSGHVNTLEWLLNKLGPENANSKNSNGFTYDGYQSKSDDV